MVINHQVNLGECQRMIVHSLVFEKKKLILNFQTMAKKGLITFQDYIYFPIQQLRRSRRKLRLKYAYKSFSHSGASFILTAYGTVRSWQDQVVTAWQMPFADLLCLLPSESCLSLLLWHQKKN